ncbi:hypothetical protein V2J09_002121 [Rumex salicifolius]
MEGAGQEQTLYSEGTKRKIADDFELAKQKALEVAARLNNSAVAAESKRPRFDSPAASDGVSSHSTASQSAYPVFTAPTGQYNGMQGASKKIHIPNGKVGVIIGRGGDMIKNLQLRSGAKIQITRDADADPTSGMRDVELMGTSDQVSRAEQLINEVIAETDAAASGGPSGNRIVNPVQPGAEQFVMKVPTEKVAMIIGKGGETIKSMQGKSGARIQVVPLHPPPGDTSTERSVYINGTKEQIDTAKELVNEIMSGNRPKTYSGSTGYTQAAYPQSGGWAPQGQPPVHQQQQGGYGYDQQGSYAMPPTYYGGYPPQQATWDQTNSSSVPPQPQQNTAYNPYGQQPVQPTSTPPSAGYNYSQVPPSSTYNYNQGYAQQPPYGQETSSTQPPPAGHEQQKPYVDPNSAYAQPLPASSQPETSQPGYGVPSDAGTNGYGTYQAYGAPPSSYNQAAGYQQMGYAQQPGAQAAQPSYPYYGQSAYPPAQANYYQGGYPPAPGQPPVQGQSTQPPSYGTEKADDGNSGAGSTTHAKESES